MSTVAIVRTTYTTSSQFRDVVKVEQWTFRNGHTWTLVWGLQTDSVVVCRQ